MLGRAAVVTSAAVLALAGCFGKVDYQNAEVEHCLHEARAHSRALRIGSRGCRSGDHRTWTKVTVRPGGRVLTVDYLEGGCGKTLDRVATQWEPHRLVVTVELHDEDRPCMLVGYPKTTSVRLDGAVGNREVNDGGMCVFEPGRPSQCSDPDAGDVVRLDS